MSRGVVLDHHAYDHRNLRNQSPFGGEDQPHQGSGPTYTDPYDSIPDIPFQTSYSSNETQYETQYGTRSIDAQQGYVKAAPYHSFPNSGYRYASFSSYSSQSTTPAHQPQPEYTGNHVGATQYTNFGATHCLSISPPTFDATRIPPPSAKMLSHYHFFFQHNNERDTVYSLKPNLKPDYHYPKTIIFTRIDEHSARTSARYNQASDGRTKDDERRKIETRKAAINGGSRLVGNIYGIEERERRYQKSISRSE